MQCAVAKNIQHLLLAFGCSPWTSMLYFNRAMSHCAPVMWHYNLVVPTCLDDDTFIVNAFKLSRKCKMENNLLNEFVLKMISIRYQKLKSYDELFIKK